MHWEMQKALLSLSYIHNSYAPSMIRFTFQFFMRFIFIRAQFVPLLHTIPLIYSRRWFLHRPAECGGYALATSKLHKFIIEPDPISKLSNYVRSNGFRWVYCAVAHTMCNHLWACVHGLNKRNSHMQPFGCNLEALVLISWKQSTAQNTFSTLYSYITVWYTAIFTWKWSKLETSIDCDADFCLETK